METKIIEIGGKKIIVGLDTDGTVIAQHYKEDPAQPPQPGGKLPEGVKDKVSLSSWLQSQGHIRGSEEYNRLFEGYGKDLPLEHYPNFKDLK